MFMKVNDKFKSEMTRIQKTKMCYDALVLHYGKGFIGVLGEMNKTLENIRKNLN